MEFGVFLNPQAPRGDPIEPHVDAMIEQTEAARDAGFDLVTTGQHYVADYVQVQMVPLFGRLTTHAGDMTIATGVILLPLHHPVEIAEQMTTLAALADDIVVGVGAGYRDAEFESFGVPKRERGPRLAEGIELMNRLWTETNVTYEGEFYAVEDATIVPRPAEKPPVWIAANAQPAIERAARLGEAWFANPHATLGEIRHQKTEYYDPLRSDRDNAVPLIREAFVAPTTEAAVEAARPYLESKYERYVEWGQNEAMADSGDLRQAFDDLVEDRFLLGTPTEVCAALERYDEAMAVSHTIVRVNWPGMPAEPSIECLELFGDEVIPNL